MTSAPFSSNLMPCMENGPRLLLLGSFAPTAWEEAFSEADFLVTKQKSIGVAREGLAANHFEAVLLEWMADKEATLSLIRDFGVVVPFVFVSSRSDMLSIVQAFKAGAADYVRRPCYFPEVLARLKARLSGRVPVLHGAGLRLDLRAGCVSVGDTLWRLPHRESRLLAALMRAGGEVIGRNQLRGMVGISAAASENTLEVYVRSLRRRHPLLAAAIRTAYGRGYYFCEG